MTFKNIDRIIRATFCFFIVFLLSIFIIPEEDAFAGVTNVTASCGFNVFTPGMTCDTFNDIAVDTNLLTQIEIISNSFDDSGRVEIISPLGVLTTTFVSSAGCPGAGTIPNGDITGLFILGSGTYTIHIVATDDAACGTNMGGWVNLKLTTLDPPTCTLTATPNSIDRGNTSVLTWAQTDAATITFDDGTGPVPMVVGFVIPPVSPVSLTTYTIAVSNSSGNDTCTAIVDINPVCTLTATPLIFTGMDSNLTWTTTDALSVTINGNPENLNGNMIDVGAANSPYTLIATNSVGATTTCNASTIVTPCEKGLVPCGRLCDALDTPWNDTDPCTFCHGILLMNQGMNFLMKIAGVVAVLALIIVGFLYITSTGNPERKNLAKTSLKWVIIGFVIIFLAWLMIDFILSAWGYLDPLGGKWSVICD